jgi:hypothetical protein
MVIRLCLQLPIRYRLAGLLRGKTLCISLVCTMCEALMLS